MAAMDEGAGAALPQATTEWRVVGFAVAAGIVAAFQVGKAAMALPALRTDLALSLAGAGWVLSVFNLTGVVAGMALGTVIGRLGDRRMLLCGLGVMAAASLAGAAAPSFALLLATRFFEGVGFLMVVIGAPTLIARMTRPADVKLAFGCWGAYMPTGQALMILAAPALLEPLGWRGLWLVNAALLVLFALAMARSTRGLPTPALGPPGALLRDARRTATASGPLLLAAIFAVYALQYLAVMGFLPTILVEGAGLPPIAAGALAALAVAANGVGNLAAGLLLRRGAARWALVGLAGLIMILAALGIFALPLPLPARYALYVVFSAFGGMLPATVLGAAPAHAPAPHLVSATNGLIVQGSNLGQVIGPPAIGYIAALWGWRCAPLLLVPAAAVLLALALALRARERRLA
jgi:MFS family permease